MNDKEIAKYKKTTTYWLSPFKSDGIPDRSFWVYKGKGLQPSRLQLMFLWNEECCGYEDRKSIIKKHGKRLTEEDYDINGGDNVKLISIEKMLELKRDIVRITKGRI
jgi:hypothetical protein